MKTFLNKIILLIAVFCVFLPVFSCKTIDKKDQVYFDNIFELRDILYYGESENYYVEICSGERESDYQFDGIAGEMTPFFLLKITPKTKNAEKLTATFEIDKMYTATIEKKFGSENFYYDFCKKMDELHIIILRIDDGVTSEEVSALNLSQSLNESWQTAMKKSLEKYRSDNDEEIVQKDLDLGFEVGLRLCRKENGELFWHFMLCKFDGKVYGNIIKAY